MPRLPRYTSIVRAYENSLKLYLSRKYGNRRHRRLKNDLLRCLVATLISGHAQQSDNLTSKLKKHLMRLERQLAEDEYRLSKAWYETKVYGATQKTAASHWRINPRDLRTLEQLWTETGYGLDQYTRLLKEVAPEWPFDVDERHEELVIWLDDRAIEDIVLVAMEAYTVPRKGVKFTETYGICFGSTKTTDRRRQSGGRYALRHVDVRSVHIQLRAIGFSNKVTYDLRSLETQMEVATHLFPQLDIVGDFHTHPYETAEELRQVKGWRYSRGDEAGIAEWVTPLKHMGYHPRTSLIVGIAEGTKRIVRPGRFQPNVVRFSVSKYHFYIACYRIIGNRYSDRHITVNAVALPGL